MTILDAGAERVANVVSTDLSNAMFGTTDTAPLRSQTGLITPQGETTKVLTKTVAGKQIQATHELLSTEGNGDTYYEFGALMNGGTTSGTYFNRVNIAGLEKTNTEEFQSNIIINIIN